MRKFMQPVRNCSECNQKTYSIGVGDYLCGANNGLATYSFKNGRGLYKQNVRKLTPSCPMYSESVEVEG